MLRRRFRGSKLSANLRLHLRFQTPRSHDDARRLRHDRRTEIAEGVSFRRRGNTDLCDHDHRYRRWFLLSVSNSFFPCGTASDEIAKKEIWPDVINSPKTAKKLDVYIAYKKPWLFICRLFWYSFRPPYIRAWKNATGLVNLWRWNKYYFLF